MRKVLLLLLPIGVLACIPTKVIERGIPAMPKTTGCVEAAIKPIPQTDLDKRYKPAGSVECAPATITATSVTCSDTTHTFIYRLPGGTIDDGKQASCANDMWTVARNDVVTVPGTFPMLGVCCAK